jgi:hypothetical protein
VKDFLHSWHWYEAGRKKANGEPSINNAAMMKNGKNKKPSQKITPPPKKNNAKKKPFPNFRTLFELH